MKKAIWFSRHAPSAAQLEEVAEMGFAIAGRGVGVRLGALNLADEIDVGAVLAAVRALAAKHSADAIFGVFAAPVQECLHCTAIGAVVDGGWGDSLPCYASWNVQRSADGGTPTFEHRRFCCVGALAGKESDQ